MWLQNDFYVLEATLSLALTAILCVALSAEPGTASVGDGDGGLVGT